MGKSLVRTLLKRHVNIYSDLYTLCFLHSYVQSPESRAQPKGITAPNQSRPPCLLVPGIWSAKQINIGIKKPLVPSICSRGRLPLRPDRKAHCFSRPKAPASRSQGANGPTRTLSKLPRARPFHLLPLPRPRGSARQQGGSWSNTWEGGRGYHQAPASWPLSHTAG